MRPAIVLRPSAYAELDRFSEWEQQPHACPFVNANSLKQHQKAFATPGNRYLTIDNAPGDPAGFIILSLMSGERTVECRRVLIDRAHCGIGQIAIREMETFCSTHFLARRIWLDVYEDNRKAIHVYEKLGYRRFKLGQYHGRRLYFYEKWL